MENQIIKTPFSFHLLSADFKNWDYMELKDNDSLIVLKKLELPSLMVNAYIQSYCRAEILDHVANSATFAIQRTAVSSGRTSFDKTPSLIYNRVYNQAKEEFIKTKKINGFEVLNLRTMNRLWISHYDMEILLKVACII